jgi:ferredoxin
MAIQNNIEIYKVTLVESNTGKKHTIKVSSDEYILDAAESEKIRLPYSCRAGSCTSCAAKVIEGSVTSDKCLLAEKEEKAGFILTCRAYPNSDCTILVDREDELLDLY